LDASLLLRRWRFGRRRNFWNLVGSRNGQGWGLHLRRKLRFVFFARSARQQQQQCHQKESELAPQCHPKWNAATISYSGSTAKLASRGEQAYDKPRSGCDLHYRARAVQVRVTASSFSRSCVAVSGSSRRKVVPRPISVTKSSAPLCNCITR